MERSPSAAPSRARDLLAQTDPLGQSLRLNESDCGIDDLGDDERSNLVGDVPGFDAAVVEEIGDDSQEMLLAPADALEILRLLRSNGSTKSECEQIRIAADRVERRSELVRHRGQKVAFRNVGTFGLGHAPCVGQ